MALTTTWMMTLALTATPAHAGDGSEFDLALIEDAASACDELAELVDVEVPSKLGYDEDTLDDLTFDCLVSLADDYGCDTVYVSDSDISDAVAKTPLWEELGRAIARGELSANPEAPVMVGWMELSPENKREYLNMLRKMFGPGWWYVGLTEISPDGPELDDWYNDPDELGDGECIK